MRIFLVIAMMVFYSKTVGQAEAFEQPGRPNDGNVFIITLDGFRWQELFTGADPELVANTKYVEDTALVRKRFWDNDPQERRKKLMPFFWNYLEKNGQLYGNRHFDNRVNVSNIYSLSYAGYNEIFTGSTDATIFNNRKVKNQNITLLEHLNKLPEFAGKVAAITSWDVFPYILNQERSRLYVDSYGIPDSVTIPASIKSFVKKPRQTGEKRSVRHDFFTFATAKEYISQHLPRVLHIGLSGTDEAAHKLNYGEYLHQAFLADKIIGWLWHMVQAMPFYQNNTTFIITTDHGRGNRKSNWYKHGFFVCGSSQTWMALLGKGVKHSGESQRKMQLYQKQLAGTIGMFLNVRSFSNYSLPVTQFTASDFEEEPMEALYLKVEN